MSGVDDEDSVATHHGADAVRDDDERVAGQRVEHRVDDASRRAVVQRRRRLVQHHDLHRHTAAA